MPIDNCPFTKYSNGIYKPILPVILINPHTNLSFFTHGIIDTGADECVFPGYIASVLGHKLEDGNKKYILTGNGVTKAYTHTVIIEVYHPASIKLLHKIQNVTIDFMPNLPVGFLANLF